MLISELKSFTEILKEVSTNYSVYFTRSGREDYAIVEVHEFDRLKAIIKLLTKLEEGEQSAKGNDWLPVDGVETALGL